MYIVYCQWKHIYDILASITATFSLVWKLAVFAKRIWTEILCSHTEDILVCVTPNLQSKLKIPRIFVFHWKFACFCNWDYLWEETDLALLTQRKFCLLKQSTSKGSWKLLYNHSGTTQDLMMKWPHPSYPWVLLKGLRDEPLIIVGGCRVQIFHLLFFLGEEALAFFFFWNWSAPFPFFFLDFARHPPPPQWLMVHP